MSPVWLFPMLYVAGVYGGYYLGVKNQQNGSGLFVKKVKNYSDIYLPREVPCVVVSGGGYE